MGKLGAVLCLIAPLFGETAGAEVAPEPGPALTAEAFDALTLGKRMDTFGAGDLYGIEEFLPGHRSIWRDASGCKRGDWAQQGDQICFQYEDHPDEPVCWVYKQRGAEIYGWYQGDFTTSAVRLVPGNSPMTCDYLGS